MNQPDYVIIHHSAGPDSDELEYQRIRWYHRFHRGWRDIGYHRLYEMVKGVPVAISGRPLNMEGAHAPGYNRRSVGVCFVGNFTDRKPGEDLLHVGARDIAGLCDVLDIHSGNILPHRAVRPTACPGHRFPWYELVELVRQYREHGGAEFGRTA